MKKARPELETWLANANDGQRIALDEFIGVLDRTSGVDSGSVWVVVETLLKLVTPDYLKGVIDLQVSQAAQKKGVT